MSLTRDIIAATIAARAPIFSDDVTLADGSVVSAELEPIADMELNSAMGRDPRESDTMHVSDRTVAARIVMGAIVTALGNRFKVLRRSDNPTSPQVDFGLMKLTDKDA